MKRAVALGNLLQAALFVGLCVWAAPRYGSLAALMGAGGALQLLGGLAVVVGRPVWVRAAAALTLGVDAAVVGIWALAAAHVQARFGDDAAQSGRVALGVVLVALPWVAAFPLWQLGRTRGGGGAALGAVVLGLVLPPLSGRVADRPSQTWPAQPALAQASQAIWTQWTTGAPMPAGLDGGEATVLLTRWVGGRSRETARGDGPTLSAALEAALPKLGPPVGAHPALVVDLARRSWDSGLLPVGEGGGLGPSGGSSPSTAWRPGGTRHVALMPQWSVPALKLGEGERPTTFESLLVDEQGVHPLRQGWTEGPPLTADSALAAAVAGGDMLLANLDEEGRFTYIVKGPSGRPGPGYNLPRHAGTTWFLARLAARTGEARFAEGARRSLGWMEARTTQLPDGRAFFAGPPRDDGRIWVGTTALASLAADALGAPVATPWGALLASAVDEEGGVRGEMDRATSLFPDQTLNPYGQGQTLLALAKLVASGHGSLAPALARAAAFVDGGYAPGAAGRLLGIDEHWACLAALATRETLGNPAGSDICLAYLRHEQEERPMPAISLPPSVGPAGGLAEAVVAGAMLEPQGPWRSLALAYGELFVSAAYRPADAAFLELPSKLTGGFRDRPFELDVQIDAVQHVGCALLGIEALISGVVSPGGMP